MPGQIETIQRDLEISYSEGRGPGGGGRHHGRGLGGPLDRGLGNEEGGELIVLGGQPCEREPGFGKHGGRKLGGRGLGGFGGPGGLGPKHHGRHHGGHHGHRGGHHGHHGGRHGGHGGKGPFGFGGRGHHDGKHGFGFKGGRGGGRFGSDGRTSDGAHLTPESFAVFIRIRGYEPGEVSAKVSKGFLIVSGLHETKDNKDAGGQSYVSRQFTRKYFLPENVDVDKLASTVLHNGSFLLIEAPIKGTNPTTDTIPIEDLTIE